MLSLFPSLLDYQFFVPTLLRVVAALVLLYVAYRFATDRREIAQTKVPVIGYIPEGFAIFSSAVIFVAAVLLFVGLYTQAAAIVGMIIGLKHAIFARRYARIMPISAGAGFLLFVICLSLLFLGAGKVAFDLPL